MKTTDAATGDVRNPKDDYSSFNPRVGLIWSLSERNEAFASVSRLYEPPTTFELENDVRGNGATLDAMDGTVYELGLRSTPLEADAHSWRWEVAAYYAPVRDEILSVDDPAAPGNSLTTNINRTTHAGLEALVGSSFAIAGSERHRDRATRQPDAKRVLVRLGPGLRRERLAGCTGVRSARRGPVSQCRGLLRRPDL